MLSSETVTATSLQSFDDAVRQAFARVPGDPGREGYASAEVERMWVTKGGVVGVPQFHVEIRPGAAREQTSQPDGG